MSAPAATKGRYRAIIERLDTWIEAALSDASYSEYYVTNDYTNLPTNLSTMPYVTIKLDSMVLDDETYGRYLLKDGTPDEQDTGSMATYFFTFHVFHEKDTTEGENENRYAHIAARVIMDHLRSKDQDSTEKVSHGIERVFDIDARESDPARLWNLRRMIVSGYLWVKRLDDP